MEIIPMDGWLRVMGFTGAFILFFYMFFYCLIRLIQRIFPQLGLPWYKHRYMLPASIMSAVPVWMFMAVMSPDWNMALFNLAFVPGVAGEDAAASHALAASVMSILLAYFLLFLGGSAFKEFRSDQGPL